MTVNILGTEYTVTVKKYDEDGYFEKHYSGGYRDQILHRIILCDMTTFPDYKDESEEFLKGLQKDTLRHEIVHAFLAESGLDSNSFKSDEGWALNEEMVDWIAIQGPKIYAAWQAAGAV